MIPVNFGKKVIQKSNILIVCLFFIFLIVCVGCIYLFNVTHKKIKQPDWSERLLIDRLVETKNNSSFSLAGAVVISPEVSLDDLRFVGCLVDGSHRVAFFKNTKGALIRVHEGDVFSSESVRVEQIFPDAIRVKRPNVRETQELSWYKKEKK